MEINGPLIISIQDEESTLKRELHIKFKPAFVQSEVSERIRQLGSYMKELGHTLQSLKSDDSDRQGIETV